MRAKMEGIARELETQAKDLGAMGALFALSQSFTDATDPEAVRLTARMRDAAFAASERLHELVEAVREAAAYAPKGEPTPQPKTPEPYTGPVTVRYAIGETE